MTSVLVRDREDTTQGGTPREDGAETGGMRLRTREALRGPCSHQELPEGKAPPEPVEGAGAANARVGPWPPDLKRAHCSEPPGAVTGCSSP